MKNLTGVTTFAVLTLLLINGVGAVGLEISPPDLHASVFSGEERNIRLAVKNPSGEVSIFRVYPDEFEDFIKIYPLSFVLESGESKNVDLKIIFTKAGQFKTTVSVVARPLSSETFSAGSGLKIPVTVVVRKNVSQYPALASSALLPSNRILGIGLLILIVAASFFIIKYGVKKIKS